MTICEVRYDLAWFAIGAKKLKMDSRLRGNDGDASPVRGRRGKLDTTKWQVRYDDDSRTIA